MNSFSNWSYSRLIVFEQCKKRAKLAFIDRIADPRPSEAADRGTRVHLGAELYVQGTGDMLPEMMKFKDEFEKLREYYKSGKVSLEGEWAFDIDWQPTAWNSETVWCRMKADAMVWTSDSTAVVIDYKTGKKFGNEIKHGEQVQLYQLGAFLRYPELETITVELWYLDVDDITTMTFTRSQGLRYSMPFSKRGKAMTEATQFPPNPNIFSCKYCPYGPTGTGDCQQGVLPNKQATQAMHARLNSRSKLNER